MTKTTCVKILLLFLLSSLAMAEDFSREEKDFAGRIFKSCGLTLEVDLHDYEYGRYEARTYSNNHFEDASLLTNEIEEACKVNPSNKGKLERVRTIFIKRGSIQERKLIQRRDGNLVYLANRVKAEQSRHKGDVIREDLVKVLKFSYVAPPDPKVEKEKVEKVEAKKAEDNSAKKQVELDKKIADLAAWYQVEVKKLTANPTAPDFSAKIENLNSSYQEKLNALITP